MSVRVGSVDHVHTHTHTHTHARVRARARRARVRTHTHAFHVRVADARLKTGLTAAPHVAIDVAWRQVSFFTKVMSSLSFL